MKGGGGATFDEHVNGVGVGGLFSVWGPSSQQTKLRQRRSQNESADVAKRSSNTADQNQQNKRNTMINNRDLMGIGLDGTEPQPNMAHHMLLVNSIINDGSLHNLVFSNGAQNSTEYLQHNKNQVTKLLSSNSPLKSNNGEYDYIEDPNVQDLDDCEDDEEEDDEQIIVTMLKSMNSKKLETCQLKEMKLEIDVEKIRQEVKLEYFKEIQKTFDSKVEAEWNAKVVKFDRLFNKIVAKKLRLDQENALEIKMEENTKAHEERMKNPFYVTLKAQKEEREKFVDFYATEQSQLGPDNTQGMLMQQILGNGLT